MEFVYDVGRTKLIAKHFMFFASVVCIFAYVCNGRTRQKSPTAKLRMESKISHIAARGGHRLARAAARPSTRQVCFQFRSGTQTVLQRLVWLRTIRLQLVAVCVCVTEFVWFSLLADVSMSDDDHTEVLKDVLARKLAEAEVIENNKQPRDKSSTNEE